MARVVRIVVIWYKKDVCISYTVVRPNINKEMGKVVFRLEWDRSEC